MGIRVSFILMQSIIHMESSPPPLQLSVILSHYEIQENQYQFHHQYVINLGDTEIVKLGKKLSKCIKSCFEVDNMCLLHFPYKTIIGVHMYIRYSKWFLVQVGDTFAFQLTIKQMFLTSDANCSLKH